MTSVYYLPARRQRLDEGLGLLIAKSGFKVTGREVTPRYRFLDRMEFGHLLFDRQVAIVREDICKMNEPIKILAGGFGAFILLHALWDGTFEKLNGSYCLISPITGITKSNRYHANPPYAKELEEAMRSSKHFAGKSFTIIASSKEEAVSIERMKLLTKNLHLVDESDKTVHRRIVWPFVSTWLRNIQYDNSLADNN